MENCFLRSVARAYVQNDALDSVFVLPNRRSLKFFQMYLGQEYGAATGRPLFSPRIITINEFFTGMSGLAAADWVELLYILYKEYISLMYPHLEQAQAMKKEPFDEFVHWGDTILKDFNDVDKYMVDARQLFTNIKELKELESDFSFLSPRQFEAVKSFWTNYLKGGKLSGKKEFFNSVWGIMYSLYRNFNDRLMAKGIGYEGMIYRNVAENVASREFGKRIVFIGFNAPNNCERRVMQYLRDCGKGDFYWDFQGSMLTDSMNGASEIIGGCVKEYPSMYQVEMSAVPLQEQKVKVYASPSGTGQAFVVEKILEELFPAGEVAHYEAFSTAVVLPDEKMLFPVLNAIPPKFKSINVTMGYPFGATALASFMELVRQLQTDVRVKKQMHCFYYKSLLELLSHEYVKKLSPQQGKEISNAVRRGNMIYIERHSPVFEGCGEFLELLLRVVTEPGPIAQYQMDILKYLDDVLDSWDREFIYQYYLKVHRLQQLDIPMEAKTWYRLLDQLCRGMIVPFKGEPLAGLQVMGTLETRALDFDNVIIISANEGQFPSSNTGQSVVPYNLRIGFGLPTYELQDGIAAYHFYRSICRAKNVFMVYDTRTEGLGTGEASRYIKQLKYHFGVQLEEIPVVAPAYSGNDVEIIAVAKSGAVMEKLLSGYTGDGKRYLSASAINAYIDCPLKFYMENVEGCREEEEVSEAVEGNVFGSIFHHVMEGLYKRYVGKRVESEDIKGMVRDKDLIGKLVLEGFAKYMNVRELEGQHLIVKALIEKYVQLALAEDKKSAPFVYRAGEGKFYCKLPICSGELEVNFKAVIDRIDRSVAGNVLRIVDYKTGKFEKLQRESDTMEELFSSDSAGKFKETVQLYLYALIYFWEILAKGGELPPAELAIYPVRKIAVDGIAAMPLEAEKLERYKELLTACVEEIFNPQIPFAANPDAKYCSYCINRSICGRDK